MEVKIKDIKVGMEGIDLMAKVTEVGPSRQVTTRYGVATVATATIADETGRIRLKLWRDQISRVRAGATVRIERAFAAYFSGATELNLGKQGRITLVSPGQVNTP